MIVLGLVGAGVASKAIVVGEAVLGADAVMAAVVAESGIA